MERAVARADAPAYFEGNLAFHDRLVELAGNAKLTWMYRRLVNELKLYRRSSLSRPDRLPASAREHRAILDQLRGGAGNDAASLLEDHVFASRERVHEGIAPLNRLPRRIAAAPLPTPARRKPRKTAKAA
jgi:DNA-binding GntR family transcriptional regulator